MYVEFTSRQIMWSMSVLKRCYINGQVHAYKLTECCWTTREVILSFGLLFYFCASAQRLFCSIQNTAENCWLVDNTYWELFVLARAQSGGQSLVCPRKSTGSSLLYTRMWKLWELCCIGPPFLLFSLTWPISYSLHLLRHTSVNLLDRHVHLCAVKSINQCFFIATKQ